MGTEQDWNKGGREEGLEKRERKLQHGCNKKIKRTATIWKGWDVMGPEANYFNLGQIYPVQQSFLAHLHAIPSIL